MEKAIVVIASPDAGVFDHDEAVGVSVTTAASAQANVHVAVVNLITWNLTFKQNSVIATIIIKVARTCVIRIHVPRTSILVVCNTGS